MKNAIQALAEIASQLKDHPDVQRGNSKVHYCFHRALSGLNSILDEKAAAYAGTFDSRMDNDPIVIQVRDALAALET